MKISISLLVLLSLSGCIFDSRLTQDQSRQTEKMASSSGQYTHQKESIQEDLQTSGSSELDNELRSLETEFDELEATLESL